MRRTYAVLVAGALIVHVAGVHAQTTAPAAQGWPRLVNIKAVAVRETDANKVTGSVPAIQGPWSARLSPDGSKVLYVLSNSVPVKATSQPQTTTPASGPVTAATQPQTMKVYRLALRNVGDAAEKILPTPASAADDVIPTLMRYNLFDPAGKRIVLGVGEDPNKEGVVELGRAGKMSAAVYTIETGELMSLGVKGTWAVPSFVHSGQGVVIWTWDRMAARSKAFYTDSNAADPRPLDLPGVPWPASPVADILPINTTPLRGRGQTKFLLFDLKAKKTVGSLSVGSPAGAHLTPQWTSDGQYLLYSDAERTGGRPMYSLFTTTYDVLQGKSAGLVGSCWALGPGPTPATMVMYRLGTQASHRGLVVYDIAKQTYTDVGERGVRPLDARGKYVLFAQSTEDGKETIFRGQIAMSAADLKAP